MGAPDAGVPFFDKKLGRPLVYTKEFVYTCIRSASYIKRIVHEISQTHRI